MPFAFLKWTLAEWSERCVCLEIIEHFVSRVMDDLVDALTATATEILLVRFQRRRAVVA